jgi:hypothetical protein
MLVSDVMEEYSDQSHLSFCMVSGVPIFTYGMLCQCTVIIPTLSVMADYFDMDNYTEGQNLGIERCLNGFALARFHLKASVMRAAVITFFLIAATGLQTSAQSLPGPSRTVFKCTVAGKIQYSDSPCLGAEKLEIDPPRGIGKHAGADVQRERNREMMADAIKPLTGMNAKPLDADGKRMQLPLEAQRECRSLDMQVPELERAQVALSGTQRDTAAKQLLSLRQRQRELRC